MKTTILLLTLNLVVGFSAWAQTPEPQITKRWAGGAESPFDSGAKFEPALIPIRLLERPYQRWTEAQQSAVPSEIYDAFWASVRSQTSKEARECLNSSVADQLQDDSASTPPGTLTILKVAKDLPVVISGKAIFEEPAWDVQSRKVATLKYFRVTQILKNSSAVPLQINEVLVMALDYGAAEVEGRKFCTLASSTGLSNPVDMTNVVESKDFLLAGHLSALGDKQLFSSESRAFRLVNGKVYPPPGVLTYVQQPVFLSFIADGLNSGGSK